MRNSIVICALFVLLAFANAETLSAARFRGINALQKDLHSESAFLSLKETPFGKNLFSMMSLKFQATGKLDTINNLLTELETNIKAQQTADDQEFATTSGAYQTTINDQVEIIATTTKNLKDWSELLAFKQDTLTQKRNQKAALEAERQSITDFLAQLEITRRQEVEAFHQRIEDQDAMVQGLDEVISIFGVEVDNNANLDKEAAGNIMTLLHQIRDSLVASIREDTSAENAAAIKYSEFVAQQQQRLRDIESELSILASEIKTLETEITNLTENIRLENIKQQAAITLKAQTEEALRVLTQKYQANQRVRADQLALIVQVRAKLNQNPTDVQQFLNGA